MLPMYDGMQKISATIFECMSKASNKVIDRVEIKDKIPKILNKIALLLFKLFEIKAVIVPANAEIIAIKDKINEAEFTLISQKSSKNFFPITVCKT